MRFSRALLFSALVGLAALPACSLKINEEERPAAGISVNPVQEGCLSNVGPVLDRYFDGEISEKEFDSFWVCLIKSFQTFSENTKGKAADHYAPEELAAFLQRFFLKGKAIPPSLVLEFMKLKQGILGGRTDQITRAELRDIVRIMQVIRRETLRLRPHLPLGSESILKRSMSEEKFEEAMDALQVAMTGIGKAFEGSIGTYSFADMSQLVAELGTFLYGHENTPRAWVTDTIRFIGVLKPAKSVLVAPPASELRQSDWTQLFNLAPRYFSLYLRYSYYMHMPHDLHHGKGLSRLNRLVADVFPLLEQSVSNHPTGRIDYAELNDLLVALAERDMLPVQLATAQALVPVIFLKIFKAEGEAAIAANGVSKANLARAREITLFFTEGLTALEGLFRAAFGETDFATRSLTRENMQRATLEHLIGWTKEKNEISKAAAEAILLTLNEIGTIFPNNASVVYVAAGKPLNQYSFSHMARIHMLRSANRLLLAAYSSSRTGFTKAESGALFQDLFPVLVDLGMLAPDNKKSLESRVFESSLFLYSSNGDEIMSMNEAIEEEALVISTISKSAQIHQTIGERCKSSARDAKEEFLVEPRCYRSTFISGASSFWDHIPGFADYFHKAKADDKNDVIDNISSFTRKGRLQSLYALGDTQAFMLMPYYVEVLFSRFDTNRDGQLDRNEAEVAFAVFRPFLAKKAGDLGYTDPKDHHAMFTYMLAYGTMPNESAIDKTRYAWWRYVDEGNFQADRGRLVRIFAKLMSF